MEATHQARTFSVGAIRCHVVSDGTSALPPTSLFPSVPSGELAGMLGGTLDEGGLLVSPFNCGVVESGGQLLLLDAGMGSVAADVGVPAGMLPAALGIQGIEPGDVDIVVISHAHVDHIGGLVRNGTMRFPRARHLLARAEWEFWMSEECERRLSGEHADLMIGAARGRLPTFADSGQLELVEGDIQVAPGVRMLPAPGHTPGHAVVAVSAGGESALFLADAFAHEVQLPHPEWVPVVDVDGELTVATRIELFDRAATNASIVTAFHVETVGRMETHQGAYRYEGRGL